MAPNQALIKNFNFRAYFPSCVAHNLNLLLGDWSNTSTKAVSFFGVVQRLYCFYPILAAETF